MNLTDKIRRIFRPPVGKNNEQKRQKWLAETLLKIPANSRILDAGAGTQQHKKFCQHLEYVSQDFGEYDGEGNSAALQINGFDYGKLDIVSDITAIPETSASFDAIMCIEVLEHLPDPSLAVKEFSRLLKSGGRLILTAPFCSLTHFAPYHFCSGLNSYWYRTHLHAFGFEIEEVCANGNYFEFLGQEINRINFVAKKYASCRVSLWRKLALLSVLQMLDNFSRSDSGSSELLCFGYHILARKR